MSFSSVGVTAYLTFFEVARALSLSKAAAVLGVSISTVSRRLDDLEVLVGVRLLDRGTRAVSLTEAGVAFSEYLTRATDEIELGFAAAASFAGSASGQLRITVPDSLGRQLFMPHLAGFLRKHPDMWVALRLAQSPPSLTPLTFDVAISGGLPADDRAVVSRLCHVRWGWCATPAWVAAVGGAPDYGDLLTAPLSAFGYCDYPPGKVAMGRMASPHLPEWRTPLFASNDPTVVVQSILAIGTVAWLPLWLVQKELLDGSLVNVVRALNASEPLYSVTPPGRGNPKKVAAALDLIRMQVVPDLEARQRD